MAKVMISVPDGFLDEIDRMAKRRHQTRSEFLREAARQYMWQSYGSERAPVRRRGERKVSQSPRS